MSDYYIDEMERSGQEHFLVPTAELVRLLHDLRAALALLDGRTP